MFDKPFDLFSLDGKVALVTGGSQGLGFEMSRAFARAGAEVYVNGRSLEKLERCRERFDQDGIKVNLSPFPVEDLEMARQAIKEIVSAFGRIDILVNNVGARLRAEAENIDRSEFSRILDINLTSAYTLTRDVVRHMPENGRVIMLGSVTGMRGRKGDPAYIASKGGLIALTKALACEYGDRSITCNAIVPGVFRTETNVPEIARRAGSGVASRLPLGRVGNPSEIVGPALFLASEASSYVTGATLAVDGGWTASAMS